MQVRWFLLQKNNPLNSFFISQRQFPFFYVYFGRYTRFSSQVPLVLLSATVPPYMLNRLRQEASCAFEAPISNSDNDRPNISYQVRFLCHSQYHF
jgi:superfamily II DNA helicase RecQ